jgi:hypothetical protein
MPDFEIVSVQEAQLRTIPGRRGKFLNEYAGYIQQLTPGKAGKIHLFEYENPATVRRRLGVAAQAMGITLIIRRSGEDVYFWREGRAEEQPRQRNGRRRQRHEETAEREQPLREQEEVNRGETEDSPELGQRDKRG